MTECLKSINTHLVRTELISFESLTIEGKYAGTHCCTLRVVGHRRRSTVCKIEECKLDYKNNYDYIVTDVVVLINMNISSSTLLIRDCV